MWSTEKVTGSNAVVTPGNVGEFWRTRYDLRYDQRPARLAEQKSPMGGAFFNQPGRLGDLAGLTRGCVDLESKVVSFTTKKTDRPMQIPLAEPLHRYPCQYRCRARLLFSWTFPFKY